MKHIILSIICSAFFFASAYSNNRILDDGPLEITNVERDDCDSLGFFYVTIEFETNIMNPTGFVIRGNGVIYDTFQYGEDFYTVGPLEGDCNTIYEFIVADLLDPVCSDFWEFDAPVCCSICGIIADDIVQLDCDTFGWRTIQFNVISENEGPDGFDLMLLNQVVGHYDYGQANYTFQIPGNGEFYPLVIRDTAFPDCQDLFSIEPEECPGQPECNFGFSQFNEIIVHDCTSDSTYSVTLNEINYEGESDSMIIAITGFPNMTIALKDLPLTIDNLSSTIHLYEIYYHEPNNIFCFNGNEWESPDCSSYNDCNIYDVIGELHACNDTSILVYVDIDFEVNNPASDSFEIRGNGTSYGIFAYGDPFYTVGPIEANCNNNYEFIVIDQANPDCRGEFNFSTPPCCEPVECDIFDIVVDPAGCTGDGEYELYLDFEYEGVESDMFDVYSGINFVGTFAYNDLPLTINNFPERDAPLDIITICDNDNPDCCTSLEFEGPDCISEDCEITEINVDPVACTGDGLYSLWLNFDYNGTTNDSFEVFSQGQLIGTFAFADLPVFIPEFPERDVPNDIITVCEKDNDDCCTSYEFDGLSCNEVDCLLYDVNVDPDNCTGDGEYSLYLNFEYEGVTNDFFEVFSQGQYIGIYAFADLPVYIESFPERDAAFDIITICVNDNPDCCVTHEFMGLDCEEMGDCSISGLVVEAYECNEDGLIFFDLNFDLENPGNQGFTVVGNGMNYGNFEYGEPFYTVGPVPGDCSTLYEFVVIDNQFIDCEAVYEFDEPFCCEEEFCQITNIEIDPLECTGDGLYSLILDFQFENVTNDFFNVYSGSDLIGTYAYADLPVLVEDFPEREVEFDIITICDNDNPDCCTTLEFIGLDCMEGACAIYDIAVDPIACTGDGLYSLILDFEFQNNTNDFFDVYSNGNLIGTYAYADLPVTVPDFPERDAEFDIIQICDNDNPTCCAIHEFIGLDCESENQCAIYDIVVDPLDCTGDGEYALILDFEYENVSNDFFDVFSNGIFIGFYAYADLPVTITNFPERDAEYDLIQICDNDNPSCCGVHEFIGPDCESESDCNITEINVDPLDCTGDGEYALILDFEYENVSGDFFDVFSNGVFVGFYAYADLPVTISNFPERDAEYDLITVCDNDNPDCCRSHEFIGPDCSEGGDCLITGLLAEAGECNEDGFFYIDFNFDYSNVGDLGFIVHGNGVVYDTFEYGQSFYTIGPLEGDCETIYELVVTDVAHPDCGDDFAFDEAFCCGEESCSISGLQAEVYECDSIGDIVFVDIWFDVNNPDANSFTVAGNGIIYDTFEYGEPFYTVGPIVADCSTIYEFVVTDTENPDCSDALDFEGPLCCGIDVPCSIDSILILEADCIDDIYILVIDIEASETGELGFDLYIDSVYHSYHLYESLPVTLELPKADYPDPFVITACDNDNSACCLSILFDFDIIDAVDKISDDDVTIRVTEEELLIEMTDNSDKQVRVFAIDGRLVHSGLFKRNAAVSLNGWHNGLYILYLESDIGYYSKKLMIIKPN